MNMTDGNQDPVKDLRFAALDLAKKQEAHPWALVIVLAANVG
jgi:hypothetical protein